MIKNIWKAYDRAIWIRFLGQVITSLGNFMIGPFLTLYMYKELHIGLLSTMAIVSLSPLVGMMTGVFAGPLSDRWGRKPFMWISLFGQGTAMLLFAFAHHPWQISLTTIFDGMFGALFWPAASAQVTDVVPEAQRGEVYSLLHMGLNIGAAIGPMLGAMLFLVNPRALILISAVTTLLTAVLILLFIPETRQRTNSSAERKQSMDESKSKPKSKSAWNVMPKLSSWREYAPILWTTLLSLPVSLLYVQVKTNLPIHLSTHFMNYTHVFAIMMTVNGTLVILLQMFISRMIRSRPVWKLIAFSYAAFAIVGVGYAFAPSLSLLLATEFVFTLGEMVGLPQLQNTVGLLAPEDKRGAYFAIFGLRWSIAETFGPLLGGVTMHLAGGKVLFTSIGILIVVAGVLLVRMLYLRTTKEAASIQLTV